MPEIGQMNIGIVGGSGRVGTALRRELSKRVRSIRVLDLNAPSELAENEEFRAVDMLDQASLETAFAGLDGLVHLAGIPREASLDDILEINVRGTSTVYEAARVAGIGRIVLGSSNHAVGFYPRTTRVSPESPMRPDGLYGLSKCWSELLAGLYYDKYGLRSFIIRIGNSADRPKTPRALEIWVSPADLRQLVLIGLTHEDVDVTTVFGVSKGGGSWWDNSAAEKLGYAPVDMIVERAAPEAFAESDESEVEAFYQGGRFVATDYQGPIRIR
ncbi:MAG: dehydrogenase [Martelella sp.]|uniref:NAD-dependent epimerase/dehydratase family protein n=1 Tax=unclassified Martelella TaxID=2629616 RepID=UPI000C6B9A4E|nr:NAD(P)-dependent oxidoreductase [Martelella sp.]MAU22308.1 dehydrogenase [Martelella sp.]